MASYGLFSEGSIIAIKARVSSGNAKNYQFIADRITVLGVTVMNPKYTFNPMTRYITRGISEQVPLEIQLLMWNEVDKIVKNYKVDYLQVFEFSVKDNYIEMEHRQEEPEYKQTIHLKK